MPSTPVAGMDTMGNILAAWAYEWSNPVEIYVARFEAGTGWGPKTRLDTDALDYRLVRMTLEVNRAGAGLLVWVGGDGIYAAAYTPEAGWGSAVTIASGPSPYIEYAFSMTLALDDDGNGLLMWHDYTFTTFLATYDPSTGEWGAPVDMGSDGPGIIVMDEDGSGEASRVWVQRGIQGPTTLLTARYVPGQGWQAPDSRHLSDLNPPLSIAADGAGGAMVAWVDPLSAFPVSTLYATRYVPGAGWQDSEILSDAGRPDAPAVDVDPDGSAVVAWATRYDKTVSARRYVPGSGWQGIEVLRQYGLGDALGLRARLIGQGGAIVTWASPEVPPFTDVRQFLPSTGWRPIDLYGAPAKGQVGGGLAFRGNAACMGWLDTYDVYAFPGFETVHDVHATPLVLPVDPDPDADLDGVTDGCDDCPTTSNLLQSDFDEDGVGDACDNCLFDQNPSQEDPDADRVGDVCDNCPATYDPGQQDPDGDGVGTACDNCPALSNHSQGDLDGDGLGDYCDRCFAAYNPGQEDADADGVHDACDNCPAVPNAGQQDSDGAGEGDACDLTIVYPLDGDVNCAHPPPTIQWTPEAYDQFRVFVSWDAAFRGKKKFTSGGKPVAANSWTIPASKWQRACSRAAPDLYVKVEGRVRGSKVAEFSETVRLRVK